MAEKDVEQRYTANLQGEVDGAALYRTLSQTEKNPQLAEVYGRLGAVGDRVQRPDNRAAGGPASRIGRQCVARRGARRQ